ncbi:alkylhydroperoxidase [Pseudomonas sp. AF76]|uniref:carboxymuconolactone decarboxylase family protein n=1 Tax=Pseudomonas sp. AF76 TaxID=554393 RepID=UPI000F46526C|nr:carboxymuconolactone decarboxylase family protein [Pseudomonas sp. AF76]ROO37416.1 alkylhydroperoxidase [Pseudomonas sp. AF76]
MQPRIDFYTASPDAFKAMMALETAVSKLGLEKSLLELVKLRSSQINGCAFCIDMHTADARKDGETERRLYAVTAWREAPFFTGRERAALAWTEALTRLSDTHAPDADYALLSEHFCPKEMVDLTVAINTINGWNRLAVGFRKMPEA